MKTFFELRESKINEETMELAGATFQNMEHCPGAVSAFKQNLKDGAKKEDVVKAAKAVDAYLAIEDKAKKSGATDADVEKMKGLIDKAKEIIDELGLEGHTYHDMHLDRVEDIIDGEDDDDDDDMNEAVDPTDTGGAEETKMAMNQVKQMRHYLDGIEKMVKDDGDMEEWVQNKLTKAADYLKSVYGYNTGKPDNMDEAYTFFKTGEEKSAFEAGKKAFRSGKKYSDNPHKDEKQKLAWSKGHNQAKARKLGVREEAEIDEAMTASQHRLAMLNKIKKSGAVKSGSMAKEKYVKEKLSVDDGMGAWIDDFKKSDAPQFKGKDEKERRDMAIAAYMSAKREIKK